MNKWKPLSEYVEKPYAGYTQVILLGWWGHAAAGYTDGVSHFGVGWREIGTDRWIDASDKKPWPTQPTHFALECHEIEGASRYPQLDEQTHE